MPDPDFTFSRLSRPVEVMLGFGRFAGASCLSGSGCSSLTSHSRYLRVTDDCLTASCESHMFLSQILDGFKSLRLGY